MAKKSKGCDDDPFLPMELPERPESAPLVPSLSQPLWTKNKAKLIERYLLYFIYITKHGTYVDGFAGPQRGENPDMWSAKLVLETEPKRLRHFHLFDISKRQYKKLIELRDSQPTHDSKGRKIKRNIQVYRGDFNVCVHELLASNSIGPKEATFCLLDQRTFECHWATVKALAEYKSPNERKIELFYFLPVGWLARAFAGTTKNEKKIRDWWGRDDWTTLRGMTHEEHRDAFVERFKELGYKIVMPYPIFEREKGKGKTMYYMILATDHPEAPLLMSRAYENAVKPREMHKQLSLLVGHQSALTKRTGESESEYFLLQKVGIKQAV